jgi:hypothetical protein
VGRLQRGFELEASRALLPGRGQGLSLGLVEHRP